MKIKSIREAFSREPREWHVCDRAVESQVINDIPVKTWQHEHQFACIKEISCDPPGECYYGKNFSDQTVFIYPIDSVSIVYE